MRFICKYENYSLALKREKIAFRIQPDGTAVKEELARAVMLDFREDVMIPAYERLYAMQAFVTGEEHPFGAMPEMQALPIVNAMGRVVDMTSEYRPDFHFSVYDTEWLDDEDIRDQAEEMLLNNAGLGTDYVLVVPAAIPPPWPTYDDIDLVTCVNMLTHGGYDLVKVMEYESSHQNREDYIVEISKILADKSAKRIEDDSLQVKL